MDKKCPKCGGWMTLGTQLDVWYCPELSCTQYPTWLTDSERVTRTLIGG